MARAGGRAWPLGSRALLACAGVGLALAVAAGARPWTGPGAANAPGAGPPCDLAREAPPPAAALEGFGTSTSGGAGKPVYAVTSLEDSGPGTLRDAVSQGDRHVVFRVGGVIEAASRVYVRGARVTIDGLTAPPPGVTLRNYGLHVSGAMGAHDVVVRGLRIHVIDDRPGAEDGISIGDGAYNVVVERVSVRGASDENIGVNGARDVTVAWSLLADPHPLHPTNMLITARARRVSVHHNLFLGARRRNPWVAYAATGAATEVQADVRNNLVWDAGGGPTDHGSLVYAGGAANIVANYYRVRPGLDADAQKRAIVVCRDGLLAPEDVPFCGKRQEFPPARAWIAGNLSADGWTAEINAKGTEGAPFPAAPVTTTDACTAARQVLAHAGARPLDALDRNAVCRIACPLDAGPGLPSPPVRSGRPSRRME
jgi:hypothetical protein